MRIAILTTDNRENDRRYDVPEPYFGTAPTGLLAGFAALHEEEPGSGLLSQAAKSAVHVPHFEVHVISCTQRPLAAPEKLASNIWFHSLVVPKWGWLRTGYAGCVQAIRRTLAEIRPDIVHAQGTERECAIGAVCSPYPRVLTIHGNLRLIRRLLKPRPWSALALQSVLEGFVVPRFDGVVCISNYTRRAVESDARKTWVVPNAVDPDFLPLGEERLRGNSESPKQTPVFLVVANVDARKNQIAFLRALDPVAAKRPFAVKFFGRCGDDDYGREFRALVDARAWATYGGMIPRDALRDEFRRAFALTLPSHEDNCPMVVLEAQAAGLPVMASNVGGVPDLVQDDVTGLLTDPDSAASMAAAAERLLTDVALVRRLAEHGHRQAVERFAPAVIARRHLEIYREVLSGGRGGS